MVEYEFDIMLKDNTLAHVKTDLKTYVDYHKVTDNKHLLPVLPKGSTVGAILAWIGERCFPADRTDKRFLLEALDLDHYDPVLIAKKTHGAMWEDYVWLKFKGENLKFNEVKLRD